MARKGSRDPMESASGKSPGTFQATSADMDEVVEVIRAGLSGDAAGSRQLLQRFLRSKRARNDLDVEHLRNVLTHVVATTQTPYQPLRLGDPTSAWEAGPVGGAERHEIVPHSGLLRVEFPGSIDTPVLSEIAWSDISQVLAEHRRFADGTLPLPPTRTVLLTGPPGTGKTMTARYVAACLSLPLLTLNLASIVEAELGRTGANVRDALLEARQLGGVLFLDELDALAAQRGVVGEVGEARRIVNVLLLELDSWPEGHLLLAATNHPELLDQAIWRRFELKVELSPPDLAGRHRVLSKAMSETATSPLAAPVTVDAVAAASAGASPADLVGIVQRAARRAAVRYEDFDVALLDEAQRFIVEPQLVSDVLSALWEEQGVSLREIGRRLDVTHPTVSKKVARGRVHLDQ